MPEQPPLPRRQKMQFTQHDRARQPRRVMLGHARHHSGHVAGPLGHAVRVDAPVEEANAVVPEVAGPKQSGTGVRQLPSQLHARRRGRLRRQLLRRQQALHAGVAQRRQPHRVAVRRRFGARPSGEGDLDQQVLQVERPAAAEATAELLREPFNFGVLGVGRQQPPREVGVALVLRRLGDLGAQDRRPPELHRRLREPLVGDDAPGEPSQTIVRVRHFRAVEARRPHVAVPSVALTIVVVRHGRPHPQCAGLALLFLALIADPSRDLDRVVAIARNPHGNDHPAVDVDA